MPGCSARFWFLIGVAMQSSHKLWNCCSQPNHVGVGTKSAVCLLTLLWHIVLFGCDRGQNSGLWMVISLVNYVWRIHLQPKWSRYAVLYSCSGTILDVTYCSGFRMWIWVHCAGHTAALGLDVIWLSGHEYHAYQNWQLHLHFFRVLFIMKLYGVKLQCCCVSRS
jgi:hypothetical protein